MISKLADLVDGKQVGTWLIVFLLVAYFLYKEWPEFQKRISKGAVKEKEEEESEKTVNERLSRLEKHSAERNLQIDQGFREIHERLDRDYKRINQIEDWSEKTRVRQESITEELSLIMEALLGALGGLQELGANGPTKAAEAKIQDYLNRKAHKG